MKFRRQDIGMSQERLAEILGVSYQQVQRYESGRNKISVERVQQIAAALAVPVGFFFGNEFSQIVAVPLYHYTPSDEAKTLLKYFEKIPGKPQREVVISVARLAAKQKG